MRSTSHSSHCSKTVWEGVTCTQVNAQVTWRVLMDLQGCLGGLICVRSNPHEWRGSSVFDWTSSFISYPFVATRVQIIAFLTNLNDSGIELATEQHWPLMVMYTLLKLMNFHPLWNSEMLTQILVKYLMGVNPISHSKTFVLRRKVLPKLTDKRLHGLNFSILYT